MTYKDILAPVITLERGEAALNTAAAIAESFDAHATALVVAVHLASVFSDDLYPLSETLIDIAKGSHSAAGKERERICAWLERAPHAFEIRDVTIEDAVTFGAVLAHARMSDLVVCARPDAKARAHNALLERLLFGAGAPVLLAPSSQRRPFEAKRIMIGWNAGREAMRAVKAALPLLQRAEEVAIATVDAKPSSAGHAEAPGRDLAAFLARRNVNAIVQNIDSMGRSESEALVDAAIDFSADLIVMGAYGHSRTVEFLLGGVTRELLKTAPLPLLLAH